MPREIVSDLAAHGAKVVETTDLLGSIASADVVYMTRIQKERFADEDEYAKVAGAYKLHASNLDGSKEDMIIMHPFHAWMKSIPPSMPRDMHVISSRRSTVSWPEWLCSAGCLNVEVPAVIGGDA